MDLKIFDAVVLAPCPFRSDPRHEYWAQSLESLGFRTLRMEVIDEIGSLSLSRKISFDNGILTMSSNRAEGVSDHPPFIKEFNLARKSILGRFVFARLLRLLYAVNHDSLHSLKPKVVIANDFFGAVLANAVWGKSETLVVYDAQEIFTESYDVLGGPVFSKVERKAWIDFESHICNDSNLVVTISPGVSDLYALRHGTECEVLPNFVPLKQHVKRKYEARRKSTRFVLIGRADPNRGLEKLVAGWDFPDEIATLDLIMPITQQSRSLMTLSSKLVRKYSGPNFLPPVQPNEMINVLSNYDVGILPYCFKYPYSHASPNKFGEYVAAGLVILANDQAFVAQQVELHSLGLVFDWEKDNFASSVQALLSDIELNSIRDRVGMASSGALNWEVAGRSIWLYLEKIEKNPIFDAQINDSDEQSTIDVLEISSNIERVVWFFKRAIIRLAVRSLAVVQTFRT